MWVVGGRLPRWSRSEINLSCGTTVLYPKNILEIKNNLEIIFENYNEPEFCPWDLRLGRFRASLLLHLHLCAFLL